MANENIPDSIQIDVSDQMRDVITQALGMPFTFAGDGDPSKPRLKVTIAISILIPPEEAENAAGYAMDIDTNLRETVMSIVSPDTKVLKIETATPEEVRDYDRTRNE